MTTEEKTDYADLIDRLQKLAVHTLRNVDQTAMLDAAGAIVELAAARRAALALLSDPAAVHVNMLRGVIAKPSPEAIIHLYGRDVFVPTTERDEVLALLREARNVIYHLIDAGIDPSDFIARIDAVVGPPPPMKPVDLDGSFKGDRS